MPQASLKYEIEVGSAGVDRALLKLEDYLRFKGKRASVTYTDENGPELQNIVGYIIEANNQECYLVSEHSIEKELTTLNKGLSGKHKLSISAVIDNLIEQKTSSCVDMATVVEKKIPDLSQIKQTAIEYVRIQRAKLAPLF